MSAMIRAAPVDRKILSKDLNDLKETLAANEELEEQRQVLPFFSERPQLWQHIYDTFSQHTPDVVGKEISIGSFFRCDLAGGNIRHQHFLFVEFEDAKANSIFSSKGWASRFNQGFNQLLDWAWYFHETNGIENLKNFGVDSIMFKGLLVIGRNRFLDNPLYLKKINHRARLMSTYEAGFQIVTYDQLCLELIDNFNYMPS